MVSIPTEPSPDAGAEQDYTVRLEQLFQGPMDLLLHLVREQEVDIHEIEINRVIDGYLEYMRELESVDIELAAEFVLMAATLMAIKSRSLLPREEVDLEEELDPRDELIQRLIEYRRFKDAAQDLDERREERSRLHAHAYVDLGEAEPELDVSDLSAWDLLSAWTRLLRETLADHKLHIASDDRPLRYFVDQLVGELKVTGNLSLRSLVERCAVGPEASKQQTIGTFCALLELMKIGVVRASQESLDADIRIVLREDLEGDLEEVVHASGLDDEALPGEPGLDAPT